MPVRKLLSAWRADPSIADNVAIWRHLPARPARFVPLPNDLHPALFTALQECNIRSLYSHQAIAWQATQTGRHVVISTGTASGKTLCYNLPIIDALLRDPAARALYLFPTKALAQDQVSSLKTLLQALKPSDAILPVSIYDGDTPANSRPAIRTNARLIFSNPDMLHTGILPHHTVWSDFFRRLKFVVIDEMHTYRGVFGSHVANVIRRLKRIAHFYGSQPQFILTSATIANPGELAGRLIEEPVQIITEDGAVRGAKTFLIYNPPVINPELGLRRSSLQESVRLVENLLENDIQTIIFGRSRRTVELILSFLRQGPQTTGENHYRLEAKTDVLDEREIPVPQQQPAIRGYRSGYLPGQRREIEHGLRSGTVRAVVATNALELGIDIGGMGAALLVGYPGTIAATWQQAGRAGRGEAESLAILVATADPLDQFLAAHPDYIFDHSPEQALINPDNLLILLGHLRCAAFELPFHSGEGFGSVNPSQLQEFLDYLTNEGDLYPSGNRYFWMANQYPAQTISLRSASADNIVLQSDQNGETITIGTIDRESAFWMTHPEAVYLHEAQTYLVESLDLENNLAHLRRMDTDYYTEPRRETTVKLLEKLTEASVAGAIKYYGEISVTSQVIGYRKVRWMTRELLGYGDLDLPPTELQTTAYWLALTDETVACLREQGLWRNDPNEYGPNWRDQRDRIRERDSFRCQVCGITEQDRAHEVHHIVPYRTLNSYEQANQLSNLITLCSDCHRRVETVVRVRSGLAGLSFVFSHLAPLFLMCDTGDLGVHSDPQSPLGGGQPTVVIYDEIPAGIGFSQRLYEIHDELVRRASELVQTCPCSDGCPSCVGPGGENGLGGKQETLAILQAMQSELVS